MKINIDSWGKKAGLQRVALSGNVILRRPSLLAHSSIIVKPLLKFCTMKKLMFTAVAALLSVGLYAQGNESYIQQVSNKNFADVKQQGYDNTSDIYQAGNAWNIKSNEAYVTQTGHDNWAGLTQLGEGNTFDATQTGHDNYVGGTGGSSFAFQNGYVNAAKITQEGYGQWSESSQTGEHNSLLLYQHNDNQYSWIVQNGSWNAAKVSQRN